VIFRKIKLSGINFKHGKFIEKFSHKITFLFTFIFFASIKAESTIHQKSEASPSPRHGKCRSKKESPTRGGKKKWWLVSLEKQLAGFIVKSAQVLRQNSTWRNWCRFREEGRRRILIAFTGFCVWITKPKDEKEKSEIQCNEKSLSQNSTEYTGMGNSVEPKKSQRRSTKHDFWPQKTKALLLLMDSEEQKIGFCLTNLDSKL